RRRQRERTRSDPRAGSAPTRGTACDFLRHGRENRRPASDGRPGPFRKPRRDGQTRRERMTMPIELPDLDDIDYDELVSGAIAALPGYGSDWTDYNPSDPGITVLEMLAWL